MAEEVPPQGPINLTTAYTVETPEVFAMTATLDPRRAEREKKCSGPPARPAGPPFPARPNTTKGRGRGLRFTIFPSKAGGCRQPSPAGTFDRVAWACGRLVEKFPGNWCSWPALGKWRRPTCLRRTRAMKKKKKLINAAGRATMSTNRGQGCAPGLWAGLSAADRPPPVAVSLARRQQGGRSAGPGTRRLTAGGFSATTLGRLFRAGTSARANDRHRCARFGQCLRRPGRPTSCGEAIRAGPERVWRAGRAVRARKTTTAADPGELRRRACDRLADDGGTTARLDESPTTSARAGRAGERTKRRRVGRDLILRGQGWGRATQPAPPHGAGGRGRGGLRQRAPRHGTARADSHIDRSARPRLVALAHSGPPAATGLSRCPPGMIEDRNGHPRADIARPSKKKKKKTWGGRLPRGRRPRRTGTAMVEWAAGRRFRRRAPRPRGDFPSSTKPRGGRHWKELRNRLIRARPANLLAASRIEHPRSDTSATTRGNVDGEKMRWERGLASLFSLLVIYGCGENWRTCVHGPPRLPGLADERNVEPELGRSDGRDHPDNRRRRWETVISKPGMPLASRDELNASTRRSGRWATTGGEGGEGSSPPFGGSGKCRSATALPRRRQAQR